MRYLILLSLMFPALAVAELPFQPVFQWEGPTEFVSGAPLDPAKDLSEFRLYCDGSAESTEALPNEGNAWEAPVGFFSEGEHTCQMTAVSLNGEESEPSNSQTFVIGKDRPRPIVTFEVR